MKINFNYRFKEIDGKLIKDDGKEIDNNLNLRRVCVNSLLTNQVNEGGGVIKVEGEEKFRRYQLAKKIHDSKDFLDLGVDDVKLLKDLVADIYAALIVGQAWEILDPVAEEVPKK